MKRKIIILFFLIFFLHGRAETKDYQRLISLKPNLTEILFALGVGDHVVGVTTYCKHPPEALKISKIGGYSNPSLEKILLLKPDLVVMIPDSTSPQLEASIRKAGIATLVLKTNSLEDVYESIEKLGEKIQKGERAQKLVREMKHNMCVSSRESASGGDVAISRVNSGDCFASLAMTKKGILVIQRSPLIVVGSGTFLSDLLKFAGIENIAGGSKLAYPRFSMEQLIANSPDVIFDMDTAPDPDFWEKYTSLPAVKNNSVYFLDPDLFVPGPRLPKALKNLHEASLH